MNYRGLPQNELKPISTIDRNKSAVELRVSGNDSCSTINLNNTNHFNNSLSAPQSGLRKVASAVGFSLQIPHFTPNLSVGDFGGSSHSFTHHPISSISESQEDQGLMMTANRGSNNTLGIAAATASSSSSFQNGDNSVSVTKTVSFKNSKFQI